MDKTDNKWSVALDWIFKAEGGDSDNPNDRGGKTRYGISLRYLKSKGLFGDINKDGTVDWKDINALTRDHAAQYYFQDFWKGCRCNELPEPVALIVFDLAVHSGVRTASMLLQQFCNATQDGVIGPLTIKATIARYYRNPDWFITSFLGERAKYYHNIVTADSSQAVFYNGWLNRLFDLQKHLLRNF